jgi:hypothetical protein
MPYHADLRCSYQKADLNMSWFYEALTEQGYEIDFVPDCEEEQKKFQIHRVQTEFESHINTLYNIYVVYKVFHYIQEGYENVAIAEYVWDYLIEGAEEYAQENEEVKITKKKEEDE